MPQVSFHMPSERLDVIDRAAEVCGISRTEFMLRSSEAAAIEVLNEHPVIAMGDETWEDFVVALDTTVEPAPVVKERYARQPQWKR